MMAVDFADYFWGPRNNGFEALYQNMKYGLTATKELVDFLKERSSVEESYSKSLTKLAKVAANANPNGSYSPYWQILKNSSEKLSTIHLQMTQKVQELVKDLTKYADDLQKKYKTVKEEEAGTLESVQQIQNSTAMTIKTKELFFQRAMELDKYQKDNASMREIEKAEVKAKKAQEEYKQWVEKHTVCREDYVQKMTAACKHFQDVESSHLTQMKEFINTYAEIMESNHQLIEQINSEFREECNRMTVEKLLEIFVRNKGTGSERPHILALEEIGNGESLIKASVSLEDKPVNGDKLSIGSEKKKEGFLRSRRGKKNKDKKRAKKKDGNSSGKEDKSDGDDKDESQKSETPTAEIDEEGYSVPPKSTWENDKSSFYSSSDSDSDDEREKRLHIEIKPLSNGTAPLSASVDELRSTVENLTLSPAGMTVSGRKLLHDPDSQMKRSQSVSQQIGSSSPPSRHPYTPLSPPIPPPNPRSSPKLPITDSTSSRYADLGDLFAEIGDIQPTAIPKSTASQLRNTPTPTATIPRPPSRPRPEGLQQRNTSSPSPAISRTESIGSLERSIGSHIIGSRGPSPLTIGMADTIPLAVAFHEIVHASFKGNDESLCQVKMTGDMMVSFPAGIIQVFANNPAPAQLSFQVRSLQPLDNLVSNKDLVNVEKVSDGLNFDFNMSALVVLLKNHAEQNPQASYFNIDILKYHISPKSGAASCPLHLVAFWKCETTQTDLRIDYKYNSHAMATTQPAVPNSGFSTPSEIISYPPLLQVCVAAPVDGGVKSMQSKPTGQWFPNTNRACWKIPSLSYTNDNQGIGSLRARFEVNNGPSAAGTIAAQFSCENSTLSGCDFQLSGSGYRVSLIKKRFVSGKYTCEAVDSASRYAVPPGPGGDSGIQI
ncbi:unnamed protein product [Orchesella dallaii]|uniref:F-BAR domain only protein 2 n=1 Tax=Orchesella dallaii TaxID=48710 RepID=A0ABP1QJS4_9HEXA